MSNNSRIKVLEDQHFRLDRAITDSAKDVTAYDLDNLDNLTFDSTTVH